MTSALRSVTRFVVDLSFDYSGFDFERQDFDSFDYFDLDCTGFDFHLANFACFGFVELSFDCLRYLLEIGTL